MKAPRSIADLLRLMQAAHSYGPKLFEDYERERSAALPVQQKPAKRSPNIYTLTIKCVWGLYLEEPCTRVLEIQDKATLLDLHYAIQDAVSFDNDHCFEFFIGRNPRNRAIIFSEEADTPDGGDCGEIELHRIWPLPDKMKLFYWFDFGDDWKFQITKSRSVKLPEKGVRYPRVVKKVGPNPQQYPDYE